MNKNVKKEVWDEKQIKTSCSFTSLIDKIYNKIQDEEPIFSFHKNVQNVDDFKEWYKNFKNKIIELLGIENMLKTRGDVIIVKGDDSLKSENLKKKDKKKFKEENYHIEHFYIKSWMDTLIPVYLAIPNRKEEGEKIPSFVCTHGHGQNKDVLTGREKSIIYPRSTWAKDLANMGIMTITMDQWGWGERGGRKNKDLQQYNYDNDEKKFGNTILQFGYTLNGLRFFDAIRQVDYLLTRDDVDPNRIGIGGLSLGGTTAGWTMAIDERISLGIIAGYMNTFKNSIIDLSHCICNYIPGISQYGEMYDIFSLHAPRSVFYITGKKDNIYPERSAKSAYNKILNSYKLFNAEDKCQLEITSRGHGWSREKAYDFIKEQWDI